MTKNLSPPLFAELALPLVSLPRAKLRTRLFLISPEVPKLLVVLQSDAIMIYEKKKSALGICFAWHADKRLQTHFFNRERLGGRLCVVLLEWKTLQLN